MERLQSLRYLKNRTTNKEKKSRFLRESVDIKANLSIKA